MRERARGGELVGKPTPDRRTDLWRLPEVIDRTGLSQSSIYRHIAAGRFPRPIHIGPRAVAWTAGSVLDWLAALEAESRAA